MIRYYINVLFKYISPVYLLVLANDHNLFLLVIEGLYRLCCHCPGCHQAGEAPGDRDHDPRGDDEGGAGHLIKDGHHHHSCSSLTSLEMVTLASHGQISPVLWAETSSSSSSVRWVFFFSLFLTARLVRCFLFFLDFRLVFLFPPRVPPLEAGSSLGLLFFLSPQTEL